MEPRPSSRVVKLVLTLLAGLSLVGCAAIEPLVRGDSHVLERELRIRAAARDLQSLGSIDVLINIDNRFLAGQIQAGMDELTRQITSVEFRDVQVRFMRQYVALNAKALVTGADGGPVEATLSGEVVMLYSGTGLVWQPRFNQISVAGTDLDSMTVDQLTRFSRWQQDLKERLDNELTSVLLQGNDHEVQIQPMPLGILEVGARLTNIPGAVANLSQRLGGVFTNAGSALLIDDDTTLLALDLNFVPSFSECRGNVAVSRAVFAREIEDREPVGLSRTVNRDDEVQYFFTEIAGAEKPTTIVHYWFADGVPVSVAELEVKPSARWRTWSSREPGSDAARTWEVIVVEKDTGCILKSMAMLTEDEPDEPSDGTRDSVRQAFADYRQAFLQRTADFPSAAGKPEVASIEVRRPFLTEVLGKAVKDVQLGSEVTVQGNEPVPLQADLGAFRAEDLQCERKQCQSSRECVLDYENCPIQRDNRSCVSCLFRNPLNNRCIREGEDPICVAARNLHNLRFNQARDACIQSQQSEQDHCERLRSQEVRSCELEAATAISTCESRRQLVEDLRLSGPVASLSGDAATSGKLSFSFSGFSFEGDLQRIHMTLGLRAKLAFSGPIAFEAGDSLGPLAQCVSSWQDDYSARASLPEWESNLVGLVDAGPDSLSTTWSGFSSRTSMTPSPLQSLFLNQPQRLASCGIGLSVDDVAEVITGRDSRFFKGDYDFAIQPLETRVQLMPAWMVSESHLVKGAARLGPAFLRYDLQP